MDTTAALASGDPEAQLILTLDKIKKAQAVDLPKLSAWNYGACEHHDKPTPDCQYRACGGELFPYQTTAVAWLYLREKGLLADAPGMGKSNVNLALLCLLKERGELKKRAIIVVNTPAVLQWGKEAARFAPGLDVEVIKPGLPKPERLKRYSGSWEVLIVGHHMLLKDFSIIEALKPGMLISDDVDPLLNHDTKIHKSLAALSKTTQRIVVCNGSSTQTKVSQLHASMVPIVGTKLWGGLTTFEKRYLKREMKEHYYFENNIRKKAHTSKVVGIKNGVELKNKLNPYVIRRSYEHLDGTSMPTLMPPTNVWLELHPRQRAKYTELQQGVVKLRKEDGTEFQKKAKALAAYTYGGQIIAGLPAIGEADGPGQSVKLDWVMTQLLGVWSDRKVVVFIKNVGLVKALQARLKSQKIGYATVWGGNNKQTPREDEIKRFWEDPDCRVMIGTSSMERSLNLQIANILVNVDTIPNPERMRQLVGRIRRAGSAHSHIFVFSLFAANTQEERTLDTLSKREAINSFIWKDSDVDESALFPELSSAELLDLISG